MHVYNNNLLRMSPIRAAACFQKPAFEKCINPSCYWANFPFVFAHVPYLIKKKKTVIYFVLLYEIFTSCLIF